MRILCLTAADISNCGRRELGDCVAAEVGLSQTRNVFIPKLC